MSDELPNGWMSVLPVRAKENSPRIYPWVAKCVGNKSRQGRQNPVLFSDVFFAPPGLGDFRIRLPTVETVGCFRVSLRDEDERRRGEMSDGLPKRVGVDQSSRIVRVSWRRHS